MLLSFKHSLILSVSVSARQRYPSVCVIRESVGWLKIRLWVGTTNNPIVYVFLVNVLAQTDRQPLALANKQMLDCQTDRDTHSQTDRQCVGIERETLQNIQTLL